MGAMRMPSTTSGDSHDSHDAERYQIGVIASPHPHAPLHMQTLAALEQVEAVHVCGVAGQDAAALAGSIAKVRSTTGDLAGLLARPDVNALVVCVRNDLCPALLEASVEA